MRTAISMISVFLPRMIPALLRQGTALALAFALLASTAWAQQEEVHVAVNPRLQAPAAQTAATPDSQQPQAAPSSDATFILPPGTTLALGLTRPLSLRSSSARGHAVYLQVTFPVTVGGRMVIPPGAYAQGTIEKVTFNRHDNPDLVLEMSSASLIFSTGYTVPLAGTVRLVHAQALAMPPAMGPQEQPGAASAANAGTGPVPAMSAAATTTPGLPPLPSLGNGPRNAMIAIGAVAGAAVIGTTIFVMRHRNDVYLDTGTPLEITLDAPLRLDTRSVSAAVQQYSAQMAVSPPQIVQPPPRMCYDPGSPGTPDTVIPGSPGTPDTVIPGANGMPDTVIPGTPATPPTVIPGTPGTPGTSYPCPKR